MKNYFIILLSILLTLTFSACNNEPKYSCNSQIDGWVKENLDELQKMEWEDIIQIPDATVLRVVFNIHTAEQKVEMWNRKISDLLELDWSNEERQHILELQSIINEHSQWFEYRAEKTRAEIESIEEEIMLVTYKWIDYCYEVLGWDKNLVAAINDTPQKVVSKNGELFVPEDIMSRAIISGGTIMYPPRDFARADCECSVESDWCSGSDKCKATDCDEPVWDSCGTLLLYKCNGMCGR